MKTINKLVLAVLAIGLVGIVSTARADLTPLMYGGNGGNGHHNCGPGCRWWNDGHVLMPWYGRVLDRNNGVIRTTHDGWRIRLKITRGRVPLQHGERFRVIPLRREGRQIVAQLRHGGDVYATVKYTLDQGRHTGCMSFANTPLPGRYDRPGPRYDWDDRREPKLDIDIRIDNRDRDGKPGKKGKKGNNNRGPHR